MGAGVTLQHMWPEEPLANPYVFPPPFSNASHSKVSKQLLATSITPCKQVLQGAIACQSLLLLPTHPNEPPDTRIYQKTTEIPSSTALSLPSHTNPLERYLRCSTQALGAEGTCWGLQRAQVVPHSQVVKAPHAVAALSGLAHPISAPFSGLDLCLLLRCCTWWCLASLAGGN